MPRLLVRHFGGILLILIFLASLEGVAQSVRQYVVKGNKELHDGYPNSAIFYYKKALKADTFSLEAHFQLGEAYRHLRNYKRAQKHYEEAVGNDPSDKKPESIYYLALMQQQRGQYAAAKLTYNSFLSAYRARDDFYRAARDMIISCDWALEHQDDSATYEVLLPDTGLNTIHAEMSPFLIDSNTLYFSTMRYESDEVKKSKPVYIEMKKAVKDTAGWSLTELDLPIEAKGMHVGNITWSADSEQVYYSQCASLGECKIFRIERSSGSWSEPIELEEPINVEGSTSTQPAIAIVGARSYLIFASDRATGKGGMDLWFTEIRNGEPTKRLRNLGTRVNTKGDEITPYFDAFDTTLYFSSNRQAGFGGFDVFKSKGVPGNFNLSENMGVDLNGSADDYYFTYRAQDSLGYFASNRINGTKDSGKETCCNDFYKVRMIPTVEEILEDTLPDSLEVDSGALAGGEQPLPEDLIPPETLEELQSILPISLYFHNDRPDPRTTKRSTKTTYPETIEEYLGLRWDYAKEISASTLGGTEKMTMGTELMNFFDRDLKGSLTRVEQALDVLLDELDAGNTIELAVKGFASPLANSDYNLNLTYRRISSMENYFREYRGGAFVPYLKSGQLKIEKIPYGESQASSVASDDENDRIRAIYSPQAANERRIEIMKVEISE